MVLRLKVKSVGTMTGWFLQMVLFIWVRDIHFRLSLLPSLSVPSNTLQKPRTARFMPLVGFQIAPLLDLARREYPAFYRDWKVISYDLNSEFDPVAHILVRSGKVKKIRFAPQEFARKWNG